MAECKCKVSKKKVKKEKGFTIIEVALVLAIAGLIFLVVFLAVPALQRNQRDDARKRDVSNVVAAITAYNSNGNAVFTVTNGNAYNNGTAITGTTQNAVLSRYIDKLSNDVNFVNISNATTISATQAVATVGTTGSTAPAPNTIIVAPGRACPAAWNATGTTALPAAGGRRAAVIVQIEAGGDGKYYCMNAS